MAATASNDEIQLAIAAAMDADFYRAVYPDFAASRMTPCAHYASLGWREDRDPAPWFSTRRYLELNPDVAAAGVNPLFHFVTAGGREGREIAASSEGDAYRARLRRQRRHGAWRFDPPDPPQGATRDPALNASPTERAMVAAEFDEAFYLDANSDVADAGVDPLEHFLSLGWREMRDPNPTFSMVDYVDAYADVAMSTANPFVHYLTRGRPEGRSAQHNLGFRFDVISKLAPVDERVEQLAFVCAALPHDPPQGLVQALAARSDGLRDVHVTFSHDDYRLNVGGVQLCLQRESANIRAVGRSHLHFHPARAWPALRAVTETCPLGVVLDGELLGEFEIHAVIDALASLPASGERSFAIHNLLGHSVDEVLSLLGALGLSDGYFWLHDFASLCAGFHLMRNDVQDCGAPPPDSPACGVCAYQPLRDRHLDDYGRLFASLGLTVVSPSASALTAWRAGWNHPAKAAIVHPHARLGAPGAPADTPAGPMRIAFLGMAAPHKGWPIFRDLALKFADDPRYTFLHLGKRGGGRLPIAFHEVSVSAERPDAMREAIAALDVDVALIWSLCRETFSFTAYEAAAAGAAVVTGPDSGNVAAFVTADGCGRVLEDEAALHAAFESGAILELARAVRRPGVRALEYSALTVDLLGVRTPA
ncbi:MAG: hypothetical protein Q8M88_01770 [Phenylobacterium sp.]|uniref:hypothetical protein n=1 Tax=Phenylobacterium sp. TaxID=1871053 RepID=UPI0027353ED7|nr:hypothetical protein [Phenylobacterium sp.]MDP3173145.1 hypothetical protein [Phenylobacterium sp.]